MVDPNFSHTFCPAPCADPDAAACAAGDTTEPLGCEPPEPVSAGAVDVGFSAPDVDDCADADVDAGADAGAPEELAGGPEPEAELLTGAEVADDVLPDPELPVLPEPSVPAVPVAAGPDVGDPVADGGELVAAALEVGG